MEELKIYEIDKKELEKFAFATIQTSKGDINFRLYANEAPQTVANFAHLANSGFYKGLKFHRVIAGFVAQGGCPYGNGVGGPGWRIKCECEQQKLHHKTGTLSMAHAGKDTGGSQFFICFEAQPHLDGVHTIFGDVLSKDDIEILNKIHQNDEIIDIQIKQNL